MRGPTLVLTATLTYGQHDPAEATAGRTWTRLVYVAEAETETQPSSLHSLDGIGVVEFRRGERLAVRSGTTLILQCPDARISSHHGRLVRHHTRWMLEDTSSKNGTWVDGVPTRSTVLADGSVLELGRTFFLFRQSLVPDVPVHLMGDVTPSDLPDWPIAMRTFSPELALEHERLVRLANSTVPMVLCGATGTGKEVLARCLHELSKRHGPMVAVNCGAIPAALAESELFGHRRGSFSGAADDRKGHVRSADDGTLFLDEIGELSPASQTALLRMLQEREVVPVGESYPIRVDVRFIAATLRDLIAAIDTGGFRGDLYARIAGHVVTLPALAERREDIGLLIAALVERHAPGRPVRIAPTALGALMRYHWPFNIRELDQAIATAIAYAPSHTIELEMLPRTIREHRPSKPMVAVPSTLDRVDSELRETLVALLTLHAGNIAAVADALGKRRQQIYKWVQRLAIDLAEFRG